MTDLIMLDLIDSKTPLPNPPGYAPPTSSSFVSTKKSNPKTLSASSSKTEIGPAKLEILRQQRAWDLAIGPAKSVPMQVKRDIQYNTNGSISLLILKVSCATGIYDVYVWRGCPDFQSHDSIPTHQGRC